MGSESARPDDPEVLFTMCYICFSVKAIFFLSNVAASRNSVLLRGPPIIFLKAALKISCSVFVTKSHSILFHVTHRIVASGSLTRNQIPSL